MVLVVACKQVSVDQLGAGGFNLGEGETENVLDACVTVETESAAVGREGE
jgi:hypothetical protein